MQEEIKVGDEVERVDAEGGHPEIKVGDKVRVTHVRVSLGLVSWTDDPWCGLYASRFRKVAPAKPVYPFKAGDVVECCAPSDPGVLTEGRTYTVRAVNEVRSGLGPWAFSENYATVTADNGQRMPLSVLHFCAPGEGRASLRQENARLKHERDLAEKQRDTNETSRQELARDLNTVADRRDKFKAKCEALEDQIKSMDKAVKALQTRFGIETVEVVKDRINGDRTVVLTKAGR